MFVKITGSDNCVHHINTRHITQVVESPGLWRVELSYSRGKDDLAPQTIFVQNEDSKQALLAALAGS
ncbi:MAG TPA: hypothetical protein VFR02_03645 [bacterium]|nr:hypothetical protein [bacterium]